MITKKQAAKLIAHAMSGIRGADLNDTQMYLKLAQENGDLEVTSLLAKYDDLPQRVARFAELRIELKTQENDLKKIISNIITALDPPQPQTKYWQSGDNSEDP
jgi:hypothetical protein